MRGKVANWRVRIGMLNRSHDQPVFWVPKNTRLGSRSSVWRRILISIALPLHTVSTTRRLTALLNRCLCNNLQGVEFKRLFYLKATVKKSLRVMTMFPTCRRYVKIWWAAAFTGRIHSFPISQALKRVATSQVPGLFTMTGQRKSSSLSRNASIMPL